MDSKYESLKLDNQLCFPLYACAREIIRQYKPFLDEIGLTYTQYIVMMVLWEKTCVNVKALGAALYLDSGTLTPLLKKLEAKGLLTRRRSETDERSLMVSISKQGEALKEQAVSVPQNIAKCTNLQPQEAVTLYGLLYKMLGKTPGGEEARENT